MQNEDSFRYYKPFSLGALGHDTSTLGILFIEGTYTLIDVDGLKHLKKQLDYVLDQIENPRP